MDGSFQQHDSTHARGGKQKFSIDGAFISADAESGREFAAYYLDSQPDSTSRGPYRRDVIGLSVMGLGVTVTLSPVSLFNA